MFNNICFVCGKNTSNSYPLCNLCIPETISRDSSCHSCGIETSGIVKICTECKEQGNRVNYSIYTYIGIPKEILKLYKFNKKYSFAIFFTEILHKEIVNNYLDYIICPVPTSYIKRKRKNGYQLDPIIKGLKNRGHKIENLLRKKYSKTQKKLNKEERGKNLLNSFKVVNPIYRDVKVLLIDDVYTTGSTIKTCIKILEQYVSEVTSLTLYRD